MNEQLLKETLAQLFAGEKGCLPWMKAPAPNKRYATLGIAQTVEMRPATGS
jgi:hypothetical protein